MVERIETGLSDDMSTFTVVEEDDSLENIDDDTGDDDTTDDDIDDKGDKGEEFFFDLDKIPEDQREAFKETFGKMQTAYKDKTKSFADLQQKAGMVDTLVEKFNNLAASVASQSQQQKIKVDTDQKGKEAGLKFAFKEDDYYRPAFEELAGLITNLNSNISDIKKGYETDKQTSFQQNVRQFVATNKVSKEVVAHMDMLAAEMGPGVYRNLPRLLKLAKVELGLPLETKTKTDLSKTKKKVGVKRQVEFGGRKVKSTDKDIKPAGSIAEAWKQSEEQLREEM